MIVRKLENVNKDGQFVDTPNWYSRRLLIRRDRMGFSLHDTVIRAGTETEMWYQNHLEAVYCIEGDGELVDVASGQVYVIEAGTVYALDRHDKHVLRAKTEMRMVCIFNPALAGSEVHDENGVYPLIGTLEDS